MPSSKVEKEIVLMVDSDDPKATIQEVSRIDSLRGYSLRSIEPLRLHDIYFDTPSGSLGRKRINLRVRKRNGDWLLTMKRNPGLLQRNRNERAELETPWSKETLHRILHELSTRGVKLPTPQKIELADPVQALKGFGLQVLQDRETERSAKDVSSTRDPGKTLAELASDLVTYHFQNRNVMLYELEVEAKNAGGDKVLFDIKTALLDRIGSRLTPWKWGKLVTGKTIGKLLETGSLDGFIQDDLLSKAGVEEVGRALQHRYRGHVSRIWT